MLGWRLISRREETLQSDLKAGAIGALQGKIDHLNGYIAKLERLLDHERERIEFERERADRATDALLLQNGTPAVTAIGHREIQAAEKERKEKDDDFRKQIADIYRETTETHYDDLGRELPEEFRESAAELLKN